MLCDCCRWKGARVQEVRARISCTGIGGLQTSGSLRGKWKMDFALHLSFVHLVIYILMIKSNKSRQRKKRRVCWREAVGRECGRGGKTTGSSSAVINLGSDTGLRGLASTAPHNWVTHRGRPTQAIMWWSVGGGAGWSGGGGFTHTQTSHHSH